MDQINNAYERIKVIMGVSGGVISVQQVQDIARLNHLDEENQAALNTMLSENGIHPIPDEELDPFAPESQPVSEPLRKIEPTPEERADQVDQALLACQKDMAEDPSLVEQYQEELPLLRKAIAEKAAAPNPGKPKDAITAAVMEISRYRVRDVRSKGWVCGTHSMRARAFFRDNWLCKLFSPEELTELIRYCSDLNAEKNPHFEEALLLFLHHTPHTIVHPRISSFYSD